MKTKILALLSIGIVACFSSQAQVRTEINVKEKNNSSYEVGEEGFNAHSFSLGVGLGTTKLYGDLPRSNPQPAYMGYFEKNLSPFISYGWTLTVGDLSCRDPYTGMRSFNHFTSVEQHINFELGTLFSFVDREYHENTVLRILGGVYAGAGIGIINNDVKRIAFVNENSWQGTVKTNSPIVLTNSTALYIPLNVGLNFHVPKLWRFKGLVFNGNFLYASTMSDYVDGYRPPFAANKKNDVYTIASLGVRFFVFQPSNDY
jgi:hypothetical protein